MKPLQVRRLGRVEYRDGLALMEAFRKARLADEIPDTLLILEHFPVFTLGRKGRRSDVLIDGAELERRGIEVYETDRGGEVTYHGPGQLVAYPILDLAPDRRDVRRYVTDLEETMLRVARELGVQAGRAKGLIGIWLGADAAPESPGASRKLGALGVHLSRWVTSHGFALNVNTALEAFDAIVACGIRDRGMTSLARELGHEVDFPAVEASVAREFAAVFERDFTFAPIDRLTVQVQVVRAGRDGPELLGLRRVPERGGFWQPITGRPEADENAQAAAERELTEETGLRAALRPLDYRHSFLWAAAGPTALAEEVAFVAQAPEGFEPKLSAEHDAREWLSLAQARERFPFAGLQRGALLAARDSAAQ